MFETRKELFSKIDAQAAEITRLETELADEQAKVSAASNTDETVAGLNEDLEAAQNTLTEVTAAKDGEIATLKASLSTAEAKATPEAIQALVTAQIAASGHPPLAVETGIEPNKDDKKMTLEAFNAMSPRKRSDFCKNGGKIID